MPDRYRVVCGPVRDGCDHEDAIESLIQILNIDRDEAERCVNGEIIVADESDDQHAMKHLGGVLHSAGLEVKIKSVKQDMSPGSAKSAGVLGRNTTMPLKFTGNGREYFKIWLTNTVLSILTLGVYSAWAKVKRNQYFFGHTKLDGVGFEYLADPKRILLGRAIGLALLIAYYLSGHVPLLIIPAVITAIVVFPWLINQSLKFRMHNTAHRNIRFRFKAGYKEAFVVYALWPIIGGISLGTLWPYVVRRHQQFVAEHTAYGTTAFKFKASIGDYYGMLGVLFLVLLGAAGVFTVCLSLYVSDLETSQINMSVVTLFAYGKVAFYYFAFSAVHKVFTTNILFRSSYIDRIRFRADLGIWSYFRLLLVNTILIVLTLGLYSPWAKVKMAQYKINHIQVLSAADLSQFAAAEDENVSAVGEEIGGFFDLEVGL